MGKEVACIQNDCLAFPVNDQDDYGDDSDKLEEFDVPWTNILVYCTNDIYHNDQLFSRLL